MEQEIYAVIQELRPQDIAEQIMDSEAICQAYKMHKHSDVADLLNNRIQVYAKRIAELRVFNETRTPSVDSSEELQDYRYRLLMREKLAFDQQVKQHEDNHERIN
jgi:hypothetical protein